MGSERVQFEGRTYYRYPESQRRHHRCYFWDPIGTSLHRAIWAKEHGAIPPGMHIHHRDGNPLNNDLGNLECLPAREHVASHSLGKNELVCQRCGARFLGRDGRFCSRACNRANSDSQHRYVATVACPICGEHFYQSKYRPKPETCSRLCGAQLRKRRA